MAENKPMSARQRLRRFLDSGELRYALERSAGAKVNEEVIDLIVAVIDRGAKANEEVIDLIVAVIDRYCAPRRAKVKK